MKVDFLQTFQAEPFLEQVQLALFVPVSLPYGSSHGDQVSSLCSFCE